MHREEEIELRPGPGRTSVRRSWFRRAAEKKAKREQLARKVREELRRRKDE